MFDTNGAKTARPALRRAAAPGRRFRKALALVALTAAAVAVWSAPANAAPEVVAQSGYAVSCSGAADGVRVQVDLYENSFYGTFVTVFVTSPEGELISDPGAPAPEDVFDDGTITADVPLVRFGGEDPVQVGTASIRGTYAVAGEPVSIHETLRDADYIVVTRGTNTPLTADLSVEVDGVTIPLSCDTAFAFDLITLRQQIGGAALAAA
ncbi:MAG TPA: hypothetical protein VGR43_02035 [Dehalococcoidia bacterium]|jgi:hypothetical protein|nr:hypothetical protein [Dehalococcoidia bacterium]